MNEPIHSIRDSFRSFFPWLVALFLAILGAKLWLVQLYGSPMWLWDQWYEVKQFFRPWLEGRAGWQDYFAPYNEHRIFCTRMWDMGVILANGRLEPMLQMTMNAALHTTYACGLAFWLWDFLGRKNGALICCLLLPFFALPYAGENTIWAFNSQAYFQNAISLLTLVWLGFERAGHWRWWLGLVMAILGLFTMVSGLLTPLTVAGLAIFRILKSGRFDRGELITMGVGLAVTVLGASLLTPFPDDEPLKAHTLMQFIAALTRDLTWPFFQAPVMALVILLPLIVLAVVYFRRVFEETTAAEFLLALALWSVLQAMALAYGRGNSGEDVPASRYMDKLNVLVIASLFATVLLARFWMNGARARKFAMVPTLIFAAVIFFGLGRISQLVVDNLLAPTRMMNLVAEERVQRFMANGNELEFFEKPTVRPDPKVIEGVLHDPKLRTIMPAANLAPTITPVEGRFSNVADGLLRHAVLFLYAGLGLALILIIQGLVRSPLGLAWENLPEFAMLALLLASLGLVWSKSPIHRESVERNLQYQLVNYFNSVNKPERAAIHQAKAAALEGK
jgi:hypothetical protein